MPLQAVGSGGTDDHLVIRSYEGKSTEEAEWLVVPSKVAPAFAELHGVFDAIRDPQTLYDLIRDHDGDLPPWDDDGRGFAPRGYDPEWLKRQRDPRKGTIRLPYLPEPLSRGGALLGLPGTAADQLITGSFLAKGTGEPEPFPDAIVPFRLRLHGGDSAPRGPERTGRRSGPSRKGFRGPAVAL